MHINHINIKAPQSALIQERDFLIEVLGLTLGERPRSNSQGYWLCNEGGEAIIHLTISEHHTSLGTHIDHIAFSVAVLEPYKNILADKGVAYHEHTVALLGVLQLFTHTPLGIKIELTCKV